MFMKCYVKCIIGGEDFAREVLGVSIYVTEKDRKEAADFRAEIQTSTLYRQKQVFFIRPRLKELLQNHVADLTQAGREYSSTLLAFCGGSKLCGILRAQKASVELQSAATGQDNHTIDFVSESYGGPKSGKQVPGEPDKGGSSTANLWDAVKRDTFIIVNTKRIEAVFEEKEDFIPHNNNREMVDHYRHAGNILRRRSIL
mmetsp:Transcript_24582/g.47103  ORF Transcript_24582/g.47103 Transcript_24582/m.47103 type:complete len:200 (-) Transcript_24582:1337-1936(-)